MRRIPILFSTKKDLPYARKEGYLPYILQYHYQQFSRFRKFGLILSNSQFTNASTQFRVRFDHSCVDMSKQQELLSILIYVRTKHNPSGSNHQINYSFSYYTTSHQCNIIWILEINPNEHHNITHTSAHKLLPNLTNNKDGIFSLLHIELCNKPPKKINYDTITYHTIL